MKIYSPEDCEQWIKQGNYYGTPLKALMFYPLKEDGKSFGINTVLADLTSKTFTHNQSRIEVNINKLIENYPPIIKILEKIHIFICPKPEIGFSNAMCWTDKIAFWGRTTQIPFCMTDYITVHELGHSIEAMLCSRYDRGDVSSWREYLTLRNAPKGMCNVYIDWDKEKDEGVYEDKEDFLCINGTHEQKDLSWDLSPTEWFAEDFRYLFGVDTGEPYWGMPIDPPDEKIREFMLRL